MMMSIMLVTNTTAWEAIAAMAYSELIKDFSRIRPYLRSFYVEGFRHRGDFGQKSARSYDNERRRMESWLGDYVSVRHDKEGRRVFLSADSRAMPRNPLYQAFRAKSFTTWDITLHFHVLDILGSGDALTVTQVMDELVNRLFEFDSDELPDESTVRKKLGEYVELGLLCRERRGRETVYALSEDRVDLCSWDVALAFFSEVAPLGVIGAFVQERLPQRFDGFRFKHHYILDALDSEVLYALLYAIGERRPVTLDVRGRRTVVLPLRVCIGTQNGRQHVIAWSPADDCISFWRLDLIGRVCVGRSLEHPADLDRRLEDFCSHAWGVAGNDRRQLDHVEMTIFVGPDEPHVAQRLERERRCGTVERLDATHWRFAADVLDALEMLPWLRTFTGRVTDLRCTNDRVVERFWEDFEMLAEMYGDEV